MRKEVLPPLHEILILRFKAALKDSVCYLVIYGVCLFLLFGNYEPLFPNGTFERIAAVTTILFLELIHMPYDAWSQVIRIPIDLLAKRIEYTEIAVTGGFAGGFICDFNFLRIGRYLGDGAWNHYKSFWRRMYYIDIRLMDIEDFKEIVCVDRGDEGPKYGFYFTKYARQIVAAVPLGGRHHRWVHPEFKDMLFTPQPDERK